MSSSSPQPSSPRKLTGVVSRFERTIQDNEKAGLSQKCAPWQVRSSPTKPRSSTRSKPRFLASTSRPDVSSTSVGAAECSSQEFNERCPSPTPTISTTTSSYSISCTSLSSLSSSYISTASTTATSSSPVVTYTTNTVKPQGKVVMSLSKFFSSDGSESNISKNNDVALVTQRSVPATRLIETRHRSVLRPVISTTSTASSRSPSYPPKSLASQLPYPSIPGEEKTKHSSTKRVTAESLDGDVDVGKSYSKASLCASQRSLIEKLEEHDGDDDSDDEEENGDTFWIADPIFFEDNSKSDDDSSSRSEDEDNTERGLSVRARLLTFEQQRKNKEDTTDVSESHTQFYETNNSITKRSINSKGRTYRRSASAVSTADDETEYYDCGGDVTVTETNYPSLNDDDDDEEDFSVYSTFYDEQFRKARFRHVSGRSQPIRLP